MPDSGGYMGVEVKRHARAHMGARTRTHTHTRARAHTHTEGLNGREGGSATDVKNHAGRNVVCFILLVKTLHGTLI